MPGIKILLSIFAFIFGAVFASFGGVVAYRVPKGLSIVKPDSYCPSCKKHIKAYDNIPILSWIILGGKCRYCKSRIGVMSLLTEILGGFGFMCAFLEYGQSIADMPIFIAIMMLVFLFVIMADIDYETHDIYNVTLVIFGVIASFIAIYRVVVFDSSIWDHIGGAALGFGFFGAVKLVARLMLGKDALGSGDVYLVGIGGFAIGAFPLLIAILVSTLLGSVIEIIKIKASRTEREAEIAFGPYLLLGMGIMLIYGEKLMEFYLRMVI